MLNYILKEPKHDSFYKKYASKKFLKVGFHQLLPLFPYLILSPGQCIRARVGAGAVATRGLRSALRRAPCPERGNPSSKG
jgi:hypothetical protein